jgi:fructosamine-3-kinase
VECDRWLADRVCELLGDRVTGLRALGGGFGQRFRADLARGGALFIKAQRDAPDGFFAHEADGLHWLGDVDGGAETATVRAVDDQLLILDWVETRTADPAAAARFGRQLAVTHDAGAEQYGRPGDTMLASEPLPGGADHADWAGFYAEARLQPFIDRAAEREAIVDDDHETVRQVISRLPSLVGPEEPPARLHGDLWSGNVLWSTDGAILIDPAAYGGHREVDLAMLQLFGLPQLDAVLAGYQDQHPLAAGWQRRVSLYQLFPLLVHAVIFGGSYGAAAGAAARRTLAER